MPNKCGCRPDRLDRLPDHCSVCRPTKQRAVEKQWREHAQSVANDYAMFTHQKLTRKQIEALADLDVLNAQIRGSIPTAAVIDQIIEALDRIASGRNGLGAEAKAAQRSAVLWKSETNPIRAGGHAWRVAEFSFHVVHAALMLPIRNGFEKVLDDRARERRKHSDRIRRWREVYERRKQEEPGEKDHDYMTWVRNSLHHDAKRGKIPREFGINPVTDQAYSVHSIRQAIQGRRRKSHKSKKNR